MRPAQRLKQPAIYAKTDEMLDASILDKRQRGTTSNLGCTKPQLGIDAAVLCMRSFASGCGVFLAGDRNFQGYEHDY